MVGTELAHNALHVNLYGLLGHERIFRNITVAVYRRADSYSCEYTGTFRSTSGRVPGARETHSIIASTNQGMHYCAAVSTIPCRLANRICRTHTPSAASSCHADFGSGAETE